VALVGVDALDVVLVLAGLLALADVVADVLVLVLVLADVLVLAVVLAAVVGVTTAGIVVGTLAVAVAVAVAVGVGVSVGVSVSAVVGASVLKAERGVGIVTFAGTTGAAALPEVLLWSRVDDSAAAVKAAADVPAPAAVGVPVRSGSPAAPCSAAEITVPSASSWVSATGPGAWPTTRPAASVAPTTSTTTPAPVSACGRRSTGRGARCLPV
jgi:hypothetical protein